MLDPLPPRSALGRRGFTLTEVLIVLALISLLVVVASPTFVKLLRDRRVSRAASTLVDYMRTARTMAIGRGQPMLLSWNGKGVLAQTFTNTGVGTISLQEPLVTKNSAAGNCTTTQWGNATFTQPVSSFDIQDGRYEYSAITFYDEGGLTPVNADLCFSASGRMFIRTGAVAPLTGAFSQVMGVPSFAVFNQDSNPGKFLGAARWVYLMPNGVARMQL